MRPGGPAQGEAGRPRRGGEGGRKTGASPGGRAATGSAADAEAKTEEELRQELEGQLVFTFSADPSLALIRETLHRLRRVVDKYYPRQTPTQRIGHEFATDALAIVGRIARASDARSRAGGAAGSPGAREALGASEAMQDCASLWAREFPAGTALDLTPFEVERLIAARRSQIAELDDEITLLQRRLNRLRDIDVRLY